MKPRLSSGGILAVLLFVVAAAAQEQPAASPRVNRFAPYEYWVGGTWVTEREVPGEGNYGVESVYEWVLGGKFIRNSHRYLHNGKVVSSQMSMIGWDAETKKMTTWGFSGDGADGGVMRLAAVETAEKDTVIFEGISQGAGGMVVRVTYRKVNDDEFVAQAEFIRNGKAMPQPKVTYNRRKSNP